MSALSALVALLLLAGFPILGVIAVVKAVKSKRGSGKFLVGSVACLIISVIMFSSFASDESQTEESNIAQENIQEKQNSEMESEKDSDKSSASTIASEETERSLQYVKDNAIPLDYKTVFRNPDQYIGQYYFVDVKIYTVEKGSWISGYENAYKSYTKGEYDIWMGDLIYLLDKRKPTDIGYVKILEDDIVRVYGKFTGLVETKNFLNGTKSEEMSLEVIYTELQSSSEQEPTVTPDPIIDVEVLSEYTLPDGIGWYTRHYMVIKNNSNVDVDISTSSLAYGEDNKMVSQDAADCYAIGPNCVSVLYEAHETSDTILKYDTDIKAKPSEYYSSVIQDLSYVQNDISGGAIFQVTNDGDEPASFVEGYAFFFKGEELVDVQSAYFTDDEFEIKPGETISEQIKSYEEFDKVDFYLSGRR